MRTGDQDTERAALTRGGADAFEAAVLAARGAEPTTELRGECPRHIVNVLDAISVAREQTRTSLVNEILGVWAEKVRHEHMMLARVEGGNPTGSEAAGGRRE